MIITMTTTLQHKQLNYNQDGGNSIWTYTISQSQREIGTVRSLLE